MAGYTQTPTGNDKNDIRNLYDWMRSIAKDTAGETLDTVTDRGATTTNSVTIGTSLKFSTADGKYTGEIKINTTTGRVEIYCNGRRQQSL